MTELATIQFLWRYMVHADRQMIDALVTVGDTGYQLEQNISLGSLEKLVDHVIAAEEAWLDRFAGKEIEFPAFLSLPRDQMVRRWQAVHQKLIAFAEAQTESSLQRPVHGRTRLGVQFALPAWACMLHLADHSTYHRGQMNTMIKNAGGKASGVMLTRYAIEVKASL